MHGPINVKSPNNISKCQVGFNSAFKGLISFASRSTTEPLPSRFLYQIFVSVFYSVEAYECHLLFLRRKEIIPVCTISQCN
jgi:hypothetical protein